MHKILLLHGALGSGQSLEPLSRLLENDFEVHLLSFDGHGKEAAAVGNLSIAGFAQEVLAYCAQHRIERINIFGYSMGGYVGLYLARHFGEKVEKLFTLGTKLNWTPQAAAKDAALLNPEVVAQKVPQYAAMLQNLHGSNWAALMEKTAQLMLDLGEKPALTAADFESMDTLVLLSVGDRDTMVSLEETIAVYRQLPKAQLWAIPHTPHPIEKVNLGVLAGQIKDFLLTAN